MAKRMGEMMGGQGIKLSHPAKLLGTWFGVGLSPIASGTCGSIAALPFAYLIQKVLGNGGLFVASLIAFFVGCAASQVYLRYTDATDPKEIVIDEVAGQWLLLSAMTLSWPSYIIGLILFRVFDIIKPWPICVSDRKIHGGFGVMFDDILAAVYPLIIIEMIIQIGRLAGYEINVKPLFWCL